MSRRGWVRGAGVAGATLGVMAAGVAVERLTVHRAVRRRARLELDSAGPYGTLRGTPGTAVAEDGAGLYFEVDEVDPPGDRPEPGGAAPTGAGPGAPGRPSGVEDATVAARPTVVFCHGYCLTQDVWHFQRAALRGTVRTVYWDQRAHGRSERGSLGPVTIDLLGRDLRAVLEAAVPEGPIVLVGHSMGGMTMMALADRYPEYVARRVVGSAFLGTSAGGLSELTFGLPELGAKALNLLAPGVLRVLGARPALVERGRRATTDLFTGVIRRYAFGTGEVDPAVVRFAERLLESAPIEVVAEFLPALAGHEKTEALAVFDSGRPALVLTGDQDQVTPVEHGELIARALRGAELVVAPGAGHLVLLEKPELINEHLAVLLGRTIPVHGRSAAHDRDQHP